MAYSDDTEGEIIVPEKWCEKLPRPAWSGYEKLDQPDGWFAVYRLTDTVYAIYEDGQFEEVISYLVLGGERAALIDTGNGISDIKALVDGITELPVAVVNTHTHGDHIGGNHQFSEVAVYDSEFSRENAKKGRTREQMGHYLEGDMVWKPFPPRFDRDSWRIHPFSFPEYLRINKVDTRYRTEIKPHFLRYMERGGFPETFSMDSAREFREYIRALVVDKIVYKDIPKIFRIEDPEFLILLLEMIARNPGMYVDYHSLSREYGKDRRVIKNYLAYLRESFLINILVNYRRGTTSLRKRKRAYPADNALIFLYKTSYDSEFFGKLVETAVVNHANSQFFWKNRNEVDIVKNEVPIEVKYRETVRDDDLKGIREFLKKFNKKRGLVITKNLKKEIRVGTSTINLIPAMDWFMSQDKRE